jgi:CheY-like chemotaxis protein
MMTRPNGSERSSPPDPESLAAVGRITAELLHDLGGTLQTLSGRVALARDEAARGRIPSDELNRIQGDADDLRRMVSEILDELRGGDHPPETTFRLRESVEETVDRWIRTAPSVTTTLRSSLGDSLEVRGPRSFFTRALWNLLRNAGRHAKGRIQLSLRPVASGNHAEFFVEDDGAGLSKEAQSSLFTPFATHSTHGLGLGLSFSRWALERLGGTLEYTGPSSTLGGATFRMTVPLSGEGSEPVLRRRWASTRGDSGAAGPLADTRLTLVDDDETLLSVLARVLRRAGAQVTELHVMDGRSVESVLDGIRDHSAADCILLDLNLGSISGLEVLKRLRESMPEEHRRVLLLTGGNPPEPPPDRPLCSKVAEWDELFEMIIGVAGESHAE